MTNAFNVSTAWHGAASEYRDAVQKLIRGDVRVIVEIGVDFGFSLFTFCIDFPDAVVFGVDSYKEYEHASRAMDHVLSHIKEFDNAVLKMKDSESAYKEWREADKYLDIDILHIDGDHTYEGVSKDFEMWSQAVRPGGVILFHDINAHAASVGKFFDGLEGKKVKVDTGGPGLGIWRKPSDEDHDEEEVEEERKTSTKRSVISEATSLKIALLKRAKQIKELYETISLSDCRYVTINPDRLNTIYNQIDRLREQQKRDSIIFATLRWVLGITNEVEENNLELEK
jgi:hypothetical protein